MRGVQIAVVLAGASSVQVQGNPIAKVIELLQGLKGKVVKEGETEQATYEEFAKWCRDISKEKQREVSDAQTELEELSATIEKASSAIETHTSSIGELSEGISKDEADLKAAEKVRKAEHEEFTKTDVELAEVVSSLERAIDVLGRSLKGSLLQTAAKNPEVRKVILGLNAVMSAMSVDQADKKQLSALVQAGEDAGQAPEAAAYETHEGSNTIMDVLNDLLEKAETQRSGGQKAEREAAHNFALLKQSLTDSIATQNKELKRAKKGKSANEEVKATATGDLENTRKELAEDQKTLSDAHASCEEKADEWNASMQSRAHEIEAIEGAVKILEESTGGGQGKAYGFVQTRSGEEVRGQANPRHSTYVDTVESLMAVGKKFRDREIAMLAVRARAAASSSADPFAKIKGLIVDMIDRLEKDAAAEADHKAFCDKEYAKSEMKKDDTQSDIDSLSAKIGKAQARIARLKREVSTLSEELRSIAQDQAEATKLRQEQHASFLEAEKDYSDGLEGLAKALKILRDYFASSSLLQTNAPKSEGAASSIIGILEVAQSDFGKLLAEARETESTAEADYEKMTEENKIATKTKKLDVKYKGEEITELKHSLSEDQNDESGKQEELDAVMDYITQLNDQCVAKVEPYEERKRRREQEIEGLKNALDILEGDAVPGFLAVKRSVRKH